MILLNKEKVMKTVIENKANNDCAWILCQKNASPKILPKTPPRILSKVLLNETPNETPEVLVSLIIKGEISGVVLAEESCMSALHLLTNVLEQSNELMEMLFSLSIEARHENVAIAAFHKLCDYYGKERIFHGTKIADVASKSNHFSVREKALSLLNKYLCFSGISLAVMSTKHIDISIKCIEILRKYNQIEILSKVAKFSFCETIALASAAAIYEDSNLGIFMCIGRETDWAGVRTFVEEAPKGT